MNHIGRVDHTEHHRNRTIVAIELPADIEAFSYGDLVSIGLVEPSQPETPPATDEGNWLDTASVPG